MLIVTELRIGTYEITDQYRSEDRDRYVKYRLGNWIFMGISTLIIISQLRPFFENFDLIPIFVILFGISGIGITLKLEMQIRDYLKEEITGVILGFDDEKALKSIIVRKWRENSNSEFTEQNIRFNQAIGFQVILEESGLITVEIIVDPEFPGTSIFQSYDFYTISEFVVLFQKGLPELDKWFYKTIIGEDWPNEYKKELTEDILVARVPWEIQKFFST